MTLGLIAPVLRKINWAGDNGKFPDFSEMAFRIYTLAPDMPAQIGNMELSSKNTENNTSLLKFTSRRNMLDGHVHELQAEVCYDNSTPLYIPKQWSYTADMKDDRGKGLKHMRIHKSAVADHGTVIIKNSRATRKLPVDGDFTISWLLFEAVRHLPKNSHHKYEFTMLDHFDQIKRDQLFYYNKSIEVNVDGTDMVLHAFDHLGRGIVPWVYWVDGQGRLLFVISGIEAYILNL